MGNIWKDARRRVVDWDRKWGLVTNKDYQQIDLELEASRQSDIFTLSLLNRGYLPMHREHVPDFLQAAKATWLRVLGTNSWTNRLEFRRRALWDSPQRDGYGYRFTSFFDGRFPRRIRLGVGLDLRQGTYDFGHMVVTDGDRILTSPYQYLQSDLKFQQSHTLQLGKMNINCALGAHLWLLQTNLPGYQRLEQHRVRKATIPGSTICSIKLLP